MRNKSIRHIFSVVLILLSMMLVVSEGYGQSKTKRLKAKEERLKKQLEQTQELLSATRKSQNSTLSELRIINKQIAYKEELLLNLDNQIKETTNQIAENKLQISTLTSDLVKLKAEYKEMIRFAYKNRNNEHNVMYLFSSDDYNQAYRRMKYIEKYAENRNKKAEEIKELQKKLGKQNIELQANIESQKLLKESYGEEKEQFLEVKKEQQVILNKILEDKGALQAKLEKQEAAREKVADAIRKEIEKQYAKNKKGTVFTLSPEAKLASKSFEKNKGKLPWPVERGTITKRFGRQKHSQVSTIYIQNDGIDISTPKGANVRAVFEGTVTSVFPISGSGQMVIISHGGYRTVYANLKTVNVKVGQKIKTKQQLGTLLPNDSGTISELHFEIWRITGDMSPQNPALWLYRR